MPRKKVEGKHQPRECKISREPVSVLRRPNPLLEEGAKPKSRDPRFDRAFGHFNADLYSKSYSFVQDLHARETKQLRDSLEKERDPRRKDSIKRIIDRRTSQAAAQARQQERQRVVKEWRQQESQQIVQGKRAWHLKQRQVDALVSQKRLDKLASAASSPEAAAATLERLAVKREKRAASRQKRRLPFDTHSSS